MVLFVVIIISINSLVWESLMLTDL